MKMLFAALLLLAPAAALAQPAAAPKELTINQCLGVLVGLQSLDGQKVVVGQGKSNESVEVVPYKMTGRVRDSISHNLFVLTAVQQEAQSANRRIQAEVGKGKTIAPGSAEAIDLEARLNEYLSRPCKAELDRLSDADLNLDVNPIPPSVLAIIFPIRDRK